MYGEKTTDEASEVAPCSVPSAPLDAAADCRRVLNWPEDSEALRL
jgi:hypothetical protein